MHGSSLAAHACVDLLLIPIGICPCKELARYVSDEHLRSLLPFGETSLSAPGLFEEAGTALLTLNEVSPILPGQHKDQSSQNSLPRRHVWAM